MNIKISIALLFIVFISNAQPQVLDRVIAIVGKNPLLLSEVETTLIQQKEKKELEENSRCKVFEDLLSFESHHKFLEGTGSLILDRVNHIAYASYSDRTEQEVILAFEKLTAYSVISFTAYHNVDGQRLPIYHTNVMMSIGDRFVLICAEAIDDLIERERVLASFINQSKEIILISEDQLNNYAGNMLQVKNKNNACFLVMSTRAFQSLNAQQKQQLEKYGTLLHSNLTTIEMLGGGSARCMMAEIFLPTKKT